MEDAIAAAVAASVDILSPEFAASLDVADPSPARELFVIPPTGALATVRVPLSSSVYLCGNSLGLQPISTRAFVLEELDKWAEHGVEGHFRTVSLECV